MPTEAQLVELYAGDVRAMVRGMDWFLPGADREDLEQEGLCALLIAVRTYRAEVGLPLRSFVFLVVRRALVNAIREARRHKHRPLTYAVRHGESDEGEEVAATELMPATTTLEQLLEAREQLRAIVDGASRLSELERRAVFGQAFGYAYEELSDGPGPRYRDVDNATQRARVKLRRELESATLKTAA